MTMAQFAVARAWAQRVEQSVMAEKKMTDHELSNLDILVRAVLRYEENEEGIKS